MEVRDAEAQQRLSALIGRVCDRNNPALDATLLSGIKHLCSQNDGNVALAWEALWGHLRAPHAQVGGSNGPATPGVPFMARQCHSWSCHSCPTLDS
jgi:hypothetical protein